MDHVKKNWKATSLMLKDIKSGTADQRAFLKDDVKVKAMTGISTFTILVDWFDNMEGPEVIRGHTLLVGGERWLEP